MIRQFQRLSSKPSIYVVLPPPLVHPPQNASCPPPFGMNSHVVNEIFPSLQRQIARRAGADGVIDVFSKLGGSAMDPNLTIDGCHLKDAALLTIAEFIAQEIRKRPTASEEADPMGETIQKRTTSLRGLQSEIDRFNT